MGASGLGSEQVHEEAELDPVPVGDEGKDAAADVVNEVEEAEDDPVGEPLLVVGFGLGLKGLDALESGVQDSDGQGQDGGAEEGESNEEGQEEAATEEDTGLNSKLLGELLHLGYLVSERAEGLEFLV